MSAIPPDSAPLRHAYICATCGSDHVTRDAWAVWDVATQDWVLDTAFDYAHCHRCMDNAHLDRVVLTSVATFSAPEPRSPLPSASLLRGNPAGGGAAEGK